ncbi:N-acetylneuraminate synthase family protein [Schleiferiaceae bacterium]|nr:N-acetylneuraminate synthase family protein [Schleiferiaceae bacterium]
MKMKFGKHLVGDRKTLIIAEAAVEHLGSLNVAKKMIDVGEKAGVDFVKFQLHIQSEEMLADKIHFWGGSLDEILDKNNLSLDDHKELIAYCSTKNVDYLCTPFSAAAVRLLDQLGVCGFKMGSGELTNFELLQAIVETGKPVIVSTGMSRIQEIEETVNFLKANSIEVALTHCTSIYPAPPETLNLKLMERFKEKFKVPVGHSDHSVGIHSSVAAVALGANIIERHFTLSKELKGPDWEVSLEPDMLIDLVRCIRETEMSLGDGIKTITKEEEVVRNWAHHSIVTIREIRAGEVFSRENLSVKRPGGGMPSKDLKNVIGKKASKNISIDVQLTDEDIE